MSMYTKSIGFDTLVAPGVLHCNGIAHDLEHESPRKDYYVVCDARSNTSGNLLASIMGLIEYFK